MIKFIAPNNLFKANKLFKFIVVLFLIAFVHSSTQAQTTKSSTIKRTSSSNSNSSSSSSEQAEGSLIFDVNPVKVSGEGLVRSFNTELDDVNGPEINLKAPMITRGAKVVEINKLFTIIGTVEDESGVKEILVNGEAAKIMSDGDFYVTIPLDYGDNNIEIVASDVKGNKKTESFVVERKMAVSAIGLSSNKANAVDWQSPITSSFVTTEEVFNVQSCINTNDSIKKVNLYQNDWLVKSFEMKELESVGKCAYALSYQIVLKLNANRIRVEILTDNGNFEDETEVLYKAFEGEYHALIIGVEEYDDPSIAQLSEPINDTYKLYEVLTKSYNFLDENVIMLKNPTKSDIIGTLHNMRSTITADDNLLIFYAGHGYWDEEMNNGYWLPRDAERNNPVNWLSNTDLINYLSVIKSKHTLLVADACFSGGIFKTRNAFDQNQAIDRLYQLPSRKAITSGTLKEVPDRSVFMKYMVKRLTDNQQRYLSAEQLYASLRVAVLNNSPNVPQYGTIHNVGDEGGDFIFIKH